MTASLSSIFLKVGRGIEYAWDWPLVRGSTYTDEERAQFKNLSQYFSLLGAFGAGGLCLASGSSFVASFCITSAAIIGGHYLAAVPIMRFRR